MEIIEKHVRHTEVDIAKTICIIGMVFVHVYEAFLFTNLVVGTFPEVLVNVIQTLVGAPCFMFCMGASIVFSSSTPEQTIKRGIHIFILAYILNITRGGILTLIVSLIQKRPLEETFLAVINEVLQIDILPFAGLALMLVGLLKKYKFNEIKICIVAVILSIIGSITRGINAGLVLNYFVGLFIGVVNPLLEEATYFPLFHWFIFVAFGYLFGSILKKSSNKTKTYGKLIPVCLIIVIAYLFYAIPNRIGMLSSDLTYYYQLTTPEAFISISSCIVYLGLLYFLSFILPKFILKLCYSFSSNINVIYCIHWVFLQNFTIIMFRVFNINSLPRYMCLLLALFTITSSYLIALYIRNRKKEKYEN